MMKIDWSDRQRMQMFTKTFTSKLPLSVKKYRDLGAAAK